MTAKTLVGRWFHSFHPTGAVEWQGEILAAITPEWYLVQLYEWLVGAPGVQRLVSVTAMSTWEFYDSQEEMRDRYEHVLGPRSERLYNDAARSR